MKIKLYAIKDALNDFQAPISTIKEDILLRDLKSQINTQGTELNRLAPDLSLYYLGEYETETGTIKAEKTAKFIINLKELKTNDNNI